MIDTLGLSLGQATLSGNEIIATPYGMVQLDDPRKYEHSGRIVIQSATNNVLIGLRILNPDPAFAEAFKATLKMSRLDQEPAPVRNPDGCVDLYIGPTAPAGMENNSMRTVGQDGWFVYFRLYAPTEPFFDKRFSLPDFETLAVAS